MRLARLFAALLVLGCAHSPAPPPGPRPLGGDASLARGAARLSVRFSYEVASARSLALLVDLDASGTGTVGTVEIAMVPEGLTIAGPASWSGEVVAGTGKQLRFPLQLITDKVARVTITHGIAGAPANDPVVFRFVVEDEEIRACQASEEACKEPGANPAP
jgi:hypothetical protein